MIFNYLLILIVLLLFAGLGLDAGMLEWRYLQMSVAAKAAAISGSLALQRFGSGYIANPVQASASLNGFTNGVAGVSVTFQNPPATGTYAGNSLAVRSIITKSVGTAFMGLVGFPTVAMSTTYDEPGPTVVSLNPVLNVYGIFRDTTTITHTGFDTNGYAYSANALDSVRTANSLGALLSWRGNLFALSPPDGLNGASNVTVTLTQAKYSQLLVLAATQYGPMASQPFVVTYTDSSTATTRFNMSDWCWAQNYTNEVVIQRGAYRLYNGSQPFVPCSPNIYGYTINLNNAKSTKSLTLPPTRQVVVMAMDLLP